jgi:hypothetical protein
MASRAERRAGELLREMAEKGERARGGGDIADKSSAKETLYDLGVTKQQSHNWQKLAALAVALVAALACPGRHHARDKISLHWKVGGVRLQNSRLPIRAILALAVWGFLSLGGANAGKRRAEIHIRQRVDRYLQIGPPKSDAGNRKVPIPPGVTLSLPWIGIPYSHREGSASRQHRAGNPEPGDDGSGTRDRGQQAKICPALAPAFFRKLAYQPQGRRRPGNASQDGSNAVGPQLDHYDGRCLWPSVPARR